MDTKAAFQSFQLGTVLITPGAKNAVKRWRVFDCLNRHVRGDWGNVCQEDAEVNNAASHEGCRILSAYAIDPDRPALGHGENCFWIITEANRESTTILLPEEY